MDPYRADENPYFSSSSSSSSSSAAAAAAGQQHRQQANRQQQPPLLQPPLVTPATPTSEFPSQLPRFPPPSDAQNVRFRSLADRQPSVIGIRRMRGPTQAPAAFQSQAQAQAQAPLQINKSLPPTPSEEEESPFEQRPTDGTGNRRRSSSEPQRPPWMTAQGRPLDRMASVPESPTNHDVPDIEPYQPGAQLETLPTNQSRLRPSRSRAFLNGLSRRRHSVAQDYQQPPVQEEYDPAIVDFLDVIGKWRHRAMSKARATGLLTGPYCRSRGCHAFLHHEHPELAVRAVSRTIRQSATDIRPVLDTTSTRRFPTVNGGSYARPADRGRGSTPAPYARAPVQHLVSSNPVPLCRPP